ncbi:MAG: DUF1822 family protein [Cyanobacteria bacterium J06621_15]
MLNFTCSQDFRFLIPENIWLESEHFLSAKQIISELANETDDNWQAYLNALALVALEVWLEDRLGNDVDLPMHNKIIYRNTSAIKTGGILATDEFKFCAIAIENLLYKTIQIPQKLIENPELIAHFYVILEVLKEGEEVMIRGFITYENLMELKNKTKLLTVERCYQLPLSVFDIEPNHMLLLKTILNYENHPANDN